MALKVDDKQLEKMILTYRNKLGHSNYFNLDKKIGNSSYPANKTETKQITNTIESFFAVYAITKQMSSDLGPSEFSENYGLFCGSLYSDSLLAEQTNEVSVIPVINMGGQDRSEILIINHILEQYVNLASRTTTKGLPKLTRGFFQSIAQSSENKLKKYPDSLEKISQEEIIIRNFKLKGIDVYRKKPAPEGGASNNDLQTIEPIDISKINITFDDIGGNYEAKDAAIKLITQIKDQNQAYF